MAKREWINTDTDDLEATPYLIKVERDGYLRAYCYANMSGVVDAYGDQAYADFIDEDSDTLTVYRLTEFGPIIQRVAFTLCQSIGMMQVTLSYRVPGVRGNAGIRSESGFYSIPGA